MNFFPSPPKFQFPQKQSNSLMDRQSWRTYMVMKKYISSEKTAGVLAKNVFGFLTIYTDR